MSEGIARAISSVGTATAIRMVGDLENVGEVLLARALEESRHGRSAVLQALSKRQRELREANDDLSGA